MLIEKFKRHIKKNGYFKTKERLELFEILTKQKTPCTIQRLVHLADNMDEATVYRNLELFEEIGVTHRIYTGWKYKVELSDMFRSHHHHMTCDSCGAVISFEESVGFERELRKLEQKYGFNASSHSLELRGSCSSCHSNRFA